MQAEPGSPPSTKGSFVHFLLLLRRVLRCPTASSRARAGDSAGLSHPELSALNHNTYSSSPAICSPPSWHLQSFAPHPHAIWFLISWQASPGPCFPALTSGAPCSDRRKTRLRVVGMLMVCLCFSLHCQINANTSQHLSLPTASSGRVHSLSH